jgi:ketosteroid isomerase-like protein
MSEQNVALVAAGWEHFRATGEPLEDILAADFVWDMSTFHGWPEQPLYEGVDGMKQFLREWSEAFDDWKIELETIHDAGEKVVCICRQTARAKLTGLAVDMRLAMVFTVRERLETRMEMYSDPAEAFDAVGLERERLR